MVKRAECGEGLSRTSFTFSEDEMRQLIALEGGPVIDAEFIAFEAGGGKFPDEGVVCLLNDDANVLSPYLQEVLELPVKRGDGCGDERCIFRSAS